MEMINNNENNDQMESASMPTQRWWSVVGDNGFGITCLEFVVIEGLRMFKNVSIMEMPSEELARKYAFTAYVGRFYMRNAGRGVAVNFPTNLPANNLFCDPDFLKREGNIQMSYFPGIPV